MNLNKVFILGNLTRDPEKKNLSSGQLVVSFGVATNRFFTPQGGEKQQETEFHNVVLFGRLAEIASQYLQKGSLVLIEGRLRTRNWQDSSGSRHYRTEIIAERMQLGPKSGQRIPPETPKIKEIAEGEIPVIEEEPPSPTVEPKTNSEPKEKTDPEKPESYPKEEKNQEEIDVKEIPF